ncbi:MAG: methyl-accepting chemotaxis sensory transducer [Herbinix sp.]|nr:methyl-accepting chemotaxis sensory transducer [Herbinix sp.]
MGKILIFEHTNILGYKMKQILTQNGFNNIEIIKDYSVINLTQNQTSERPACIVVDLDDRNHDMIQVIKRIKEETNNAPIISLSQDSNLSTLKKAIGVGCREFVLKPFEAETLISKVYKLYYDDQEPSKEGNTFLTEELFKENAISLKWSEDYMVGVEQIDLEHQKIFEHFNKLYSLMREGHGHEYYGELIGFLADYVNTHFEHEEQYQLKTSFQEYQKHKAHHDKFSRRINEIMENHKDNRISDNDLISISLFIKDWLIHHILLEDMKIKDTLKVSE